MNTNPPDYAIPLYLLPLPQLYELVRIEGDRLGLSKTQLQAKAREFFGGEIPEVRKPADLLSKDKMKKSSKSQLTWIFQSKNREGLSPQEVERLTKIREARKAKKHTLDPNR